MDMRHSGFGATGTGHRLDRLLSALIIGLPLLLWQLAYLIMFSQFSLDAVRRRKRGDA